jgi:hypothetical protein
MIVKLSLLMIKLFSFVKLIHSSDVIFLYASKLKTNIMTLDNYRKIQFRNWFSIYGLLFFLCLPTWNVIYDIYNDNSDNLIELQEKFEKEVEENTNEKDIFEKYNAKISFQPSVIKNTSILATTIHYFELNNIASDVVTPPPERC